VSGTRKHLRARLKVWVELGGLPVFGDGKCRWLELIDQAGSLRATAEALGMSYRGLWGRLRGMEDRLGVALVERRTGGPAGGGVRLTEAGRRLASAYRRFRDGIDLCIAKQTEAFLAAAAAILAGAPCRPSHTKPSRRRKT
jgi:molybdate transport system regulatory protein